MTGRAALAQGSARGVTPDARSGSGPARDGSASVLEGGSAAGASLDERAGRAPEACCVYDRTGPIGRTHFVHNVCKPHNSRYERPLSAAWLDDEPWRRWYLDRAAVPGQQVGAMGRL
jgi:hypothetical protein